MLLFTSALTLAAEPVPSENRVSTLVAGMDAANEAAVREASDQFRTAIATYRRSYCPALDGAAYLAEITYVPELQRTVGAVRSFEVPMPELEWHPSGRFMPIGCQTILALAACLTWPIQQVFVVLENDDGEVAFGFSCTPLGPEPTSLEAGPKGGLRSIEAFSNSSSGLVMPAPAVLPDGTPNDTEVLRRVVGEREEDVAATPPATTPIPKPPAPATHAPPRPMPPVPSPAPSPPPPFSVPNRALDSTAEPTAGADVASKHGKRPLQIGGGALAAAGLITVLGTWSWYRTDPDVTPQQWRNAQIGNAGGWTALVGGGVLVSVGSLGGEE